MLAKHIPVGDFSGFFREGLDLFYLKIAVGSAQDNSGVKLVLAPSK